MKKYLFFIEQHRSFLKFNSRELERISLDTVSNSKYIAHDRIKFSYDQITSGEIIDSNF